MNETTRRDELDPNGLPIRSNPPDGGPPAPAPPSGRKFGTLAHVLLTVVVATAAGSVTALMVQDDQSQSTSALSPEIVPAEVTSTDAVAAVAQALAPSVVQIETEGGLGSG